MSEPTLKERLREAWANPTQTSKFLALTDEVEMMERVVRTTKAYREAVRAGGSLSAALDALLGNTDE